MTDNELTNAIIGAAIEVPRTLGPGLLEGVYEDCLAMELNLRGICFERQKRVPVQYTGHEVAADLKIGKSLGLLIDFNVPLLRQGVRRIVHNFPELCASASLR